MIKALVVIRESTERQEIETQKAEAINFAKTFGYNDSELMVIGQQGASAISLNDKYEKSMKEVYNALESIPSIERVCAIMLDRIARDEVVFFQFKNYLIKRKINLNIKHPSLFLLDENGEVNNGMEISINLFTTMAKQEMLVKQARFKRIKADNKAKGKYNGGKKLYGYDVNKDGYFVAHKTESLVVQLIYTLYGTDKYSYMTIKRELDERGINLTYNKVTKILRDRCYCGERDNYPSLVDKELWEKCKIIRSENGVKKTKESKNMKLGTKTLKCLVCGHNYIYAQNGERHNYVCIHNKYYKNFDEKEPCRSPYINADIVDACLESVAKAEHMQYLLTLSATTTEELTQKKAVLEMKITVAEARIPALNTEKKRLALTFAKGLLQEKELDEEVARINADIENINNDIKRFKDEIKMLDDTLKDVQNKDWSEVFLNDMTLAEKVSNVEEVARINAMVKKHIKVAYVTDNYLNDGYKFKTIYVVTVKGEINLFIYDCNCHDKLKQYIKFISIDEDGNYHDAGLNYCKWLRVQMNENFKGVLSSIQDDLNKVKSNI